MALPREEEEEEADGFKRGERERERESQVERATRLDGASCDYGLCEGARVMTGRVCRGQG